MADRLEELEEALREILDVTSGWTRPMTPEERMNAIEDVAMGALGIRD